MAARLTKAAAGLLGACIGCVIGPLACLPALSVFLDSVDEADLLTLLLLFACAGAGVGLAIGVRIAGRQANTHFAPPARPRTRRRGG